MVMSIGGMINVGLVISIIGKIGRQCDQYIAAIARSEGGTYMLVKTRLAALCITAI
jgi:hypothetical protein